MLREVTFLNRRYLMTELTSLGSQSSKLKMEHFRQLQEFLLELAPELGPAEVAAEAVRFSAEDTFRFRADAGSRISPAAAAAAAAEQLKSCSDCVPRIYPIFFFFRFLTIDATICLVSVF